MFYCENVVQYLIVRVVSTEGIKRLLRIFRTCGISDKTLRQSHLLLLVLPSTGWTVGLHTGHLAPYFDPLLYASNAWIFRQKQCRKNSGASHDLLRSTLQHWSAARKAGVAFLATLQCCFAPRFSSYRRHYWG